MPLPCFVCARELESAVGDREENQPYAGTRFRTEGHYGSTAFDPQSSMVELHLNICDPCLVERADRTRRVVIMRKTRYIYEPWQPRVDGEDG